jgi:hypothetical protein
MAKQYYHLCTKAAGWASSGNAILAIANKTGSGKKINIHSIEVQNNTRFGYTQTANTNLKPPTRFRIGPVTGLGGGQVLTPVPCDSQATWPATVILSTDSSFTPVFVDVGAILSYTATAASAGPYTVAAQTPAWTTNEHRDAQRYFRGITGNVGIWEIASNAATTFTLTKPLPNSGASTGVLSTIKSFAVSSVTKTLLTSTSQSYPAVNYGYLRGKDSATGSIFDSSVHTACQSIVVRANEQVAVFVDFIHDSFPMFVSVDLIVEGTPNRTYKMEFYTYLTGERNAVFAINNPTGSGQVIHIENVDVSEVGTYDTAYLQVVPIASVDASTYNDTNRNITAQVFANDSTSATLTNAVCSVFTNTPILPQGVPVSYIAASSPGATTIPPGLSYLNTKDFIGPMYMAMFPEASAFKRQDTAFWGYSTPGTLASQLSHNLSIIKGQYAPLVLREGEGIALCSGAETAAGATVNSVGVSGWSGLDFNIRFSVENTFTPSITLTGLPTGCHLALLDNDNANVILSEDTNTGTSWVYSFDYPGTDKNVSINIIHQSWGVVYLSGLKLYNATQSFPVAFNTDRVYKAI